MFFSYICGSTYGKSHMRMKIPILNAYDISLAIKEIFLSLNHKQTRRRVTWKYIKKLIKVIQLEGDMDAMYGAKLV